jgi:hypothetical protein
VGGKEEEVETENGRKAEELHKEEVKTVDKHSKSI